MKLKLGMGVLVLAGTFLVGAPSVFSQVSVGIVIGTPPAPRVIAVRPPCPEPEFEGEYAWVATAAIGEDRAAVLSTTITGTASGVATGATGAMTTVTTTTENTKVGTKKTATIAIANLVQP